VNNKEVLSGLGITNYGNNSLQDSDQIKVMVEVFDQCVNKLYDTSNIITFKVIGNYPSVKVAASAVDLKAATACRDTR